MQPKKAQKLIYKIISSMPIDVLDDEECAIWEQPNYELTHPRLEGDFEGSREIGAANIITAFNLLHQKMLIAELSKEDGFSECIEEAMTVFKDAMDGLEKENIIRKRPEIQRETFKIIGGTSVH